LGTDGLFNIYHTYFSLINFWLLFLDFLGSFLCNQLSWPFLGVLECIERSLNFGALAVRSM